MDGAEDSMWQPVSTNVIANFTIIGQPAAGRRASAWRDNDRTQIHNSIIMDVAEQVVKNDVWDGDHCTPPPTGGYGGSGMLDFPTTWAPAHTNFSSVNAPANPPGLYKSQTPGHPPRIPHTRFFPHPAADT